MNKIYRVIWSKVRNCYVVVSEIAKAHSKGGSTARRVPHMGASLTSMLLASVLSLGISAPVWAESSTGAKYYGVNYSAEETGNLNGEGASGMHSIAAGVNAKATGENAISIGYSANAGDISTITMIPTIITNKSVRKFENGLPKIVNNKVQYWSNSDWQNWDDAVNGTKQEALIAEMNYRSKENGGTDRSIAIGNETFSLKDDVVIGNNAYALGSDSVVIGRNTTAFDNSVALGTLASAAHNSIAIGGIATDASLPAARATANYSIAIGNQAQATSTNAMALGIGASATGGLSTIAIGYQANKSVNEFYGFSNVNLDSFPAAKVRVSNKVGNDIVVVKDDNGKPVYYEKKVIIDGNEKTYKWNEVEDKKTQLGNELTLRKNERDASVNSNSYKNSISIGENTNSLSAYDISIGSTAIVAGEYSVAIGRLAKALTDNNIAIGTTAITGADFAIAIGYSAQTLGSNSNAIGKSAKAAGSTSNAIGNNAQAMGGNSNAVGNNAKATGGTSNAIGNSAQATGANSNAVGNNAKATGGTSNAIGNSAQATGGNSNAIGKGAQTSGDSSTAIGNTAIATGPSALALGTSAKAENQDAIAIGRATASDMNSIAIGSRTRDTYYTQASGNNSIAIGLGTQTFKANTVALGNGAKSYGYQSSTVGFHSYSFGDESTVFGHDSTAHGRASSAFGYLSTAGAVTLLKGDKDQNYQDAWSRIRVVKAETDTEGNIIYTRLGNKSAGTGDDGPNEYEIVTTASGQVVALKRDTAERAQNADGKVPPDYYKITELRTVSNLKSETGSEIKNHQGYWFVVDTSDDGKIDNIDDTNTYGGQTEGGVAVGDYANAVGNKSLAVGRSTVADGNNSAAIGMFANAYGTGGMAYGQNTSTGLVSQITLDKDQYITNLKKPTADSGAVNSQSVAVYRRLVNGNTAFLNKLNEYVLSDGKDSEGNKVPVKMNAKGEVVAYWKGAVPTDDTEYLNPDKWTSVTTPISVKGKDGKIHTVQKDASSNRYYYGRNTYISDTDEVTLSLDGKTVTLQAGNLMLTEGGVAMGAYAHAEGEQSLALGRVAGAYDKNSAAVGQFANALGEDSVVIGHNASAGAVVEVKDQKTNMATVVLENGSPKSSSGTGGIAMGSYSHAVGTEATAIGSRNIVTGENSIAIGTGHTVNGNNSGAFGDPNVVNADSSYVFGNSSKIEDANITDAFILGNNASVTQTGGVALGSKSAATTGLSKGGYNASTGSKEYTDGTSVWQSTDAAVSVGKVDGSVTRQITNVAAGSEDTDAVNVAQLKKVAASAGGSLNFGGDNTTETANIITVNSGEQLNVKGGIKDKSKLTDNNIGVVADDTTNTLSVKLSNKIKLNDGGHLKIGETTDENGQTVVDQNGITLYPSTSASGSVNTRFTRNGISAGDQKIENVAEGVADTDAVNVSQLKAAKTEVTAGTNVIVEADKTSADGHTIFKVSADNLTYKANGAIHNVKLADGLNFTNGKNTVAKVEENGIVTIDVTDKAIQDAAAVTDKYVTGGSAVYSADGKGTLTLKRENAEDVNIEGLQDFYTTAGTFDANTKKATFTRNGLESYVLDLSAVSTTDYRLVGAGTSYSEAYKVSDDGTVILNVQDQMNPTDVKQITINGIATSAQAVAAKTEVTAGTNVEVVPDIDKTDGHMIYKVKLADNISLTSAGSLTIGNATGSGQTVLDQNGLTIYPSTSSTEPVAAKFTKSGISAGNQKIEGVAAGEADTDAVNVSQLEKAKEEAISNVKLKFRGESGDTLERGNNEILQIVGDGSNITTKAIDGKIKVELSKDLKVDSLTAGDTAINTDGLTIKDGPSVTKDGINAGSKIITGVADGQEDTDAVNLRQLKQATEASKTVVKRGTNIASVDKSTGKEGQTIYTINADGSSVSGGSDAVKVTKGKKDKENITDYAVDLSDKTKATLDKVEKEGLTFAGDTGASDKIKLGEKLNLKGGATGTLSDGNIGVEADGDTLNIKLAKEIKDVDSITVNNKIEVGDNTTIGDDTITTRTVNADTVKAGGTTIDDNGITTDDGNGPSVTKDGIDAGGKKITNVAPGTADNDAVNMSQLRNASGDIYNTINRLDNSTRKGIAGAAALAALHPMDFNPDDKLQFSAGVGNYRGETAAAVGMFYRPDESVMFSLGGTFGNSDNMVNAGITFGLDGTRNRITRSRTAMAREIQDLRSLVTQMAARMDRLEGANVETAMFPDVPENHWAYEYVEDLQKRGALKGYPDGLFKGDRAMTRYEFAAMLDRLVRSGVTLDSKIAKEFEPELGRIYVERISGQDNDRKKVERVRVNNSDSKYPEGKTRDVYGSKIVTEVPKAAEAK